MEKIRPDDLYSFHFLSNIVISPDGAHAVFSKINADQEKNAYTSELWLMNTGDDTYKRLTTSGNSWDPFWLDNSTVVFSVKQERPADTKQSKWYKIAIDGGEAEEFLQIDERVTSIKLLSEELYIVTASRSCGTTPEQKPDEAQEGKDLYVFDEIPFWFNGRGIRNKIRNTVMLYHTSSKELTPVSPQYLEASEFQISPDKQYIAYAGKEYADILPRGTGLYLYHIASGQTTVVVPQDGMGVSSLCFVGEEKIFFAGTPFDFPGCNPRCYLYDIPSGMTKELPFYDTTLCSSISTDAAYTGGSSMKYTDGKVYFSQVSWGSGCLSCLDASSGAESICARFGSVICFDLYENKALVIAMQGTSLPEVWSVDLLSGEEKRLTDFNTEYIRTHSAVQPESFRFTTSSGIELEGFLLKPLHYEPGKTYPGILEIHGGPKITFGGIFHHEMQCLASEDYFVFFTNPRGSDGRGEELANITGQLGYVDFDDLMEFTDEVLRRYPELDEKRLGICGGSYGGFMCNWMIGHTGRFAAAVSQRSISNYVTKILCTDIGFYANMAQMAADPWSDFDRVWEHSPLKYAPNAVTPTLFIQSDEDYRCWMSDALSMFTALKINGVDSRLVLFHGENHNLSRSGRPRNRITRLQELHGWFEKYLKNEPRR